MNIGEIVHLRTKLLADSSVACLPAVVVEQHNGVIDLYVFTKEGSFHKFTRNFTNPDGPDHCHSLQECPMLVK